MVSATKVPNRRAEIAALKIGDLHQNRGYDCLRVARKGGRRDALAINPQTAARLRAYLEASGHGADIDGPLFRPLKHNGKRRDERRGMDPDAIDRVVRKYAGELGLDRGYSAHSMRATFITTALENGAQLEDVQKAAGHRDPGTTKLYDRRGYNHSQACTALPQKASKEPNSFRLPLGSYSNAAERSCIRAPLRTCPP
jgi:integrase